MTELDAAQDNEVTQLRARLQNLEDELTRYQELEQLRARVQELEAELARREAALPRRNLQSKEFTRAEGAPDEGRLARQRLGAEEFTSEVDATLRESTTRATDETSRLMRGMMVAWLEALRSVADSATSFLEVPRRVVDTFGSTSHEGAAQGPHSSRMAGARTTAERREIERENAARDAAEIPGPEL